MSQIRYIAALSTVLCLSSAFAQTLPTFNGLQWLSSKADVFGRMTDLGFKFNSPDDNDMYFTGSVRDEQAVVLTQFNDKDQLSRIVVVFDTRNIVSLYSGLKDHLDSKYGESEDKNEVIPFNNDAEVSKAILQGKTVSSIWVYPAYLPLYFLTLRLTKPYVGDDSIHVTLEYQSPAWVDESKRRTRNSDL